MTGTALAIGLGVGIPVLYVAIGCAVGILLWDHWSAIDPKCELEVPAVLSGVFWPFTVIFVGVYALIHGKARKKSRLHKAQKLVQKNIKNLETELGL